VPRHLGAPFIRARPVCRAPTYAACAIGGNEDRWNHRRKEQELRGFSFPRQNLSKEKE